ncbi:MAG: hypothetical protein JO258_18740 [Alphaproteobacteria bacterium]|nr:hypothetical protein [Alphaproteobacteria bacterium]
MRIPGTCVVGDRAAEDVFVTDISARGCKVRLVSIGVTKAEPVTLRLGSEAPITGHLTWVKQASVGMAFDRPLGEAVLARVSALRAPANVVPLRRAKLGEA